MSLYERVGGDVYFFGLVERLYEGVEGDPLLRPIYPEDLEQGKANLAEFLIQNWGGPQNYSARRGHPRLRMRHLPFPIGRAERDAWMGHMRAAIDSVDLAPPVRAALLEYFENAATAMMNRGGAPF